jgi:2-polyprenyl-3-methyl-5-hydroxy-6-metoxy-1,4-benzoquinol methylase
MIIADELCGLQAAAFALSVARHIAAQNANPAGLWVYLFQRCSKVDKLSLAMSVSAKIPFPPGMQDPLLPFEPLPTFYGSLQDEPVLARNHHKRIGILIVTHNALSTFTRVLKRITPDVWNNVEEIAVFDNASQDHTYELAMGLKTLRSLPKLQVLTHPQNLGYGGNQKAGYRYFIEKGFDVVVLLHGDGRYAPEILSHLYHPIVTGEADAVFGSRMLGKYGGPLQGGMPIYKYLGNRILSAFESQALGLKLTEFHSGYRAYSLHALKKIDFTHMTDDYHFDTELIIKLHHQHYQIKEVPIPTYYGSELSYGRGVKYARSVFQAVRRYKKTSSSSRCFPEFQEYFVHYPIKQSKGSSHYYALQMVGKNNDVLDVACGEGFFAAEIARQENRVFGIDVLPQAARETVMHGYYSADLNAGLGDVLQQLHGKRFDRVLLLDILEHLQSPERILKECHSLLEEGGEVVVSVPNVANLSVRLMLLFGEFNYTDRGILDSTHQRWYTRKTARKLLAQTGYNIVAEKMTVVPVALALGLAPEGLLFNSLNWTLRILTRMLPTLLGYQIMLVGRPVQGSPS